MAGADRPTGESDGLVRECMRALEKLSDRAQLLEDALVQAKNIAKIRLTDSGDIQCDSNTVSALMWRESELAKWLRLEEKKWAK